MQQRLSLHTLHLFTMTHHLLLLFVMLVVVYVVEAQEPTSHQSCCQAQGQAHVFCCRSPRKPGQLPECCNPPPPPASRNPPRPPRYCWTSNFPKYCCAMSPRNTRATLFNCLPFHRRHVRSQWLATWVQLKCPFKSACKRRETVVALVAESNVHYLTVRVIVVQIIFCYNY